MERYVTTEVLSSGFLSAAGGEKPENSTIDTTF